MKKAIKKFEATIEKSLNLVCEQAKVDIHGFVWITHTADFNNFPTSLRIICVFDTQKSLELAQKSGQKIQLIDNIFEQLLLNKIMIDSPTKTIGFDTEESGAEKRLIR